MANGHCRHCDADCLRHGIEPVRHVGAYSANVYSDWTTGHCPMCAEAERTAVAIETRAKELRAKVESYTWQHYGATEPGSVDWETVAHIDGMNESAAIARGGHRA